MAGAEPVTGDVRDDDPDLRLRRRSHGPGEH